MTSTASTAPGSGIQSAALASPAPPATVKRLRVLAIAHLCEPERGSESSIGWAMVCNLSVDHEVTVLAEAQQRAAVERYFAKTPHANLRFVFVEVPFWKPEGITRRSHPRLLDFVYYSIWEVLALAAALRAGRHQWFDVVHHINFANVLLPPLAALLPGRFIWGPIGPIEGMPWAFLRQERPRVIARDLVRKLALAAYCHASPTGLLARTRASALLFKTTTAAAQFRKSRSRFHAIVQDGLQRPVARPPEEEDDHAVRPLRLLTVSRLEAHKGVRYAISGLARLLRKGGHGRLVVIGDGPERDRLESAAAEMGLQALVSFLGYVRQSKVLEEMQQADVLIHPSFRDGLASAPLEALGASVPVLCQQRSGMIDLVDDTCGILVKAESPEELSEGFGASLLTLYKNPRLRARLRTGALRRRQDLAARHSIETLRAAYCFASAAGG